MPTSSAEPDPHKRPALNVLLAAPRGFCAGVDRAIQIVELALAKFGAPVYVRHEIVHNRYVVESLKAKGAVFVEELHEIPETDQPVIFSAHGVPKSVPLAAKSRNLFAIDATRPLVFKVHMEATRHHAEGRRIQTTADAERVAAEDPLRLAYVTQTTLSVDDTAEIVAVLKRRFPAIVGPHKEDICYATTNRQSAVKAIAGKVGLVIVVGAPNSSNSLRLVEVAERAGCPRAILIQRAADIPWAALDGVAAVGVTAGASAPETLVDEVLAALKERFEISVEQVTTANERIAFNVPRELREPAA